MNLAFAGQQQPNAQPRIISQQLEDLNQLMERAIPERKLKILGPPSHHCRHGGPPENATDAACCFGAHGERVGRGTIWWAPARRASLRRWVADALTNPHV